MENPAGVIVLPVVPDLVTQTEVTSAVRRHTGGRPQDDQALLALRRSPG
ncbi:hypothetical protein ACTU45_04575 [Streptomyces sp. 24-1644]